MILFECLLPISCNIAIFLRPNKKNKCVSGNGSENFRLGRHTYFFLKK